MLKHQLPGSGRCGTCQDLAEPGGYSREGHARLEGNRRGGRLV